MKSIAIWYKPSENEDIYIENIELHFNLWKLPNGSSDYLRFLDIGIKLDNTKNITELKLYFPFKLESQDFEDIIHRFIAKPDLVSAIFNENYKTTSYATSNTYTITDSNDQFVFNVYQTSKEDISFEEKYSGTIVKIKCPESNKKTYFRLRVKGPYLDSLSTIQKPSNSFIQSAFSKTEMVDFRVNEARDLNQSLLEEINKERKFNIKKAHFFFICSYNEDVLGSHQPYRSCRNLENYRWIDYVGVESLRNQIFLAYHWKQDESKNDLNILIKTKFEKSSWKTILLYLAVLFVMTVVFNLFSNWIFESLK